MGKPGGVRAAKAAATRARMLAAAKELFVRKGYAATSVQAIATEAGVAVQTVYFTFSTKRAILKELIDVAVAGDVDPVATLDRPWVAEALAAPPPEQIERLVASTGEIHMRVAQVLEVVRSAAASDPEIDELWYTNKTQRLTVLTAMVGALAAKTPLRGGLTLGRAADVAMGVLSPEMYVHFVGERGWRHDDWREWGIDALNRLLLPDPFD